MMKHLLQTLIILLLFVSQVLGQSARLKVIETKYISKWKTVCTPYGCKRVRVREKKEFFYLGMSVCLGRLSENEWLFASCSHNFGESGTIKVLCQNKWTDGIFVARTNPRGERGDLALIKVTHTGELKCAPLADTLEVGQAVTYVKRNGNRISAKIVSDTELRGQAPVEGDSGTAIYNTEKEVIGILWGSLPSEVHYTSVYKLKKFIINKVGTLPICGSPPSVVAPSPPIETEQPIVSYDHTDILSRIKKLENKKPFDSSQLIIANKRMLERLVKWERLVEGLQNQEIIIEWIDLDGNVVLTKTFPSNRIRLYANTIDIYNGNRIDRDTYKPNEPMVIRVIKKDLKSNSKKGFFEE